MEGEKSCRRRGGRWIWGQEIEKRRGGEKGERVV